MGVGTGAFIASAAIAAGTSAASNIANGVQASNLNGRNRRWQERMMQRQRDWALEDWERENDVSAWSDRVSNAGLNPALVAGQSSLSQPSSVTHSPQGVPSPQQFMAHYDASGFANAASLLLQGKQVDAQTKVANAQSVSSIIDAALEAYKVGGKDAFNNVVDKFAPYLKGSNPEDSWYTKEIKSRIYNIDMDSLNKDLAYELSKKYSPEQIQTGIEETNQAIAESVGRLNTMHVNNEIALKKLGYELGVLVAEKFNLRAQGSKAAADAATINALRNYTKRAAKAQMEMSENEAYSSNVYRENFENAAGWLTSSEGKEFRGQQERINLKEKGSYVIRGIDWAFDKITPIKLPMQKTLNFNNY